MFRRVILEDWHVWVPYFCFALTFAAFIFIVIWALLLKKPRIDHDAALPLEDDADIKAPSTHKS